MTADRRPNYFDPTPDKWLYDLAMQFEEDQWAYRQGFTSAHAYHQATDEAFDSAQASIEQWERE